MKTALALLLTLCASLAWAEPVVTLRNNGPDGNRLNLVVMGDGYTADEMLKFSRDTDLLLQGFFAQEPFLTYAPYFNVRRVDVVSPQSGADHPERGQLRNTALGATFNCRNIPDRLCINPNAVTEVLSRSLTADLRDLVIVLVNDPEPGYAAGFVAVASTHALMAEQALHAVGHTLGQLADEYEWDICFEDDTPSANVTRQADRSLVKWAHWINADTPVPTAGTAPGVVGLYDFAVTCPPGLFRPTFDSKMRTLSRPFEQINTEQLTRRIYNFVSPIDSVTPASASLEPVGGEVVAFGVTVVPQVGRSLQVVWRVDGVQVGTSTSLALPTSGLGPGVHRVEVDVADVNPAVRQDPTGALTERRAWTLTMRADILPGDSLVSAGGAFRLTYQTNGSLVLVDRTLNQVVWTANPPTATAGRTTLQADGNFVVYDGTGTAVFFTGTSGNPGARLVVQDDGNVVVYGADGQALWNRLQ